MPEYGEFVRFTAIPRFVCIRKTDEVEHQGIDDLVR